MSACPFNPASESIADFIYRYGSLQLDLEDREQFPCVEPVSRDYAVIHLPLEGIAPVSLRNYPYYSIPNLFTLLDNQAMEASGILSALQTPALAGAGRGALIGIVDTGIDYTNPMFRYSDGTTRIAGIWDQTLPEGEDVIPEGVPEYYPGGGAAYGTEFTREQIDEALASDSPLSLVPSRDTNGHGTFLAGIAAGNRQPEEDFTGAAPGAELVVVKLKQAKSYLREFYLAAEGSEVYQENDIMMGIKYLRVMAARLRRPIVILIALGSNLGSHEGSSPLSMLFRDFSGYFGIASVIAAGNETGFAHHYLGHVPSGDQWEDVEIRVGPEEARRGFTLELWSSDTDTYSVGFLSPGGERINRIPIISGNETSIPFLLESTVITVNYELIEAGSGRQLTFIRFRTPAQGIWNIRVYNSQFLTGIYHMWLPTQGMISDETVFLRPDPYNTVTLPGNAQSPITVGAYDHRNGSIYIHSSRGYALNGAVKPELAAPGVAVLGPGGRGLTEKTGTSIGAAITAGAAACLLSWGIVEGNEPSMSETAVKSYLIRGAKRNPAFSWPNREFGYGTLDLLQSFLNLRE
ncbi:MAG: S8 family peptidase [Clostridiales bacterium]|nr:S8 family peptidase [Clostridiales bacterium]